ncbi:protein misato 1-like protein [Corchorus olitorius]|uniref:Protein misato 1-like protein n=1 Tax=Corchorus olitorius TaxID=93759 RepID=A0A1R3KEJ5_9ROSI|nr:protein misato 1-like protein [Corchorus olitorius]
MESSCRFRFHSHNPTFATKLDPPLDLVPFASFTRTLNARVATIDRLLDFNEQKASEEASKVTPELQSPKDCPETQIIPFPSVGGFLRARYGPGELFPTPIVFEHPSRAKDDWIKWVKKMLSDPSFVEILKKGGVLPS